MAAELSLEPSYNYNSGDTFMAKKKFGYVDSPISNPNHIDIDLIRMYHDYIMEEQFYFLLDRTCRNIPNCQCHLCDRYRELKHVLMKVFE
jgi:hypothetical protein